MAMRGIRLIIAQNKKGAFMGRTKFKTGDRVIGNDKKASFAGRKGTIVRNIREYSQYQVLFDDGVTETVYSWWIDPLKEPKK